MTKVMTRRSIMNRSMSRVAVVVILLFALVLGGCSRSDGVPTLIWWQVGTRQLSFARDQKVISDYVYDKIGVRVEFRLASWADASQRFNTLVNAGEYFDIMFTDSGNYNRFASLGHLRTSPILCQKWHRNCWKSFPAYCGMVLGSIIGFFRCRHSRIPR